MCGIGAIFAYGRDAPRIDRDALLRIREAMALRGPDGAGSWHSEDDRCGLAHRRLAIIDLTAAAAQPMASADGRYHITYNGEIYNYRALRDELKRDGVAFVTDSDTEVLLALYARDGAAMLDRLRGMYAFAIWDAEKRGMFLARDPLGIKPLYFADDGRTLRIASQVKALLAGSGIDTAPAPAGHVGFFLWGYVPEPHTLYRGIHALGAGAWMWIDSSGPGPQTRHFDLTRVLATAAEEAAEEAAGEPWDLGALGEALADSVAHHLVADVPVGVFLSSGLDSATLVSLAAEIKGTELRTVTLGFDDFRGKEVDEVPLAERIAGQFGTDHRTSWIGRADFDAESDRLMAAMDQPTIDGVNSYFVSKVTAETGLKVAISGLGGDEMFGGYASFREVPLLARVLKPFRFVPGFGRGFRAVSAPVLKHFTSPKYAGLFEYGTSHADAYLLRRGLFMPWELPELLDADLVRDGWRELAPRAELEATVAGIGPVNLRISALETAWYMRNQLLRDSDWAGMAHSLEIRTPLVDAVLLRRLAPMLAAHSPPGKRDMALSPARRLPAEVLNRPKTGFSVPIHEWLGGDTAHHGGWGFRQWARHIHAAQWTS